MYLTHADDNEWILVNNNVKPRIIESMIDTKTNSISNVNNQNDKKEDDASGEGFSVLDLAPETHYKLRMTAHNSAGSTVDVYDFTTLTFGGATVAPELIIHSEYNYGFIKILINPSIILPVVLALIVIVSMLTFVFHQVKKDNFAFRGKYQKHIINYYERIYLNICLTVNKL